MSTMGWRFDEVTFDDLFESRKLAHLALAALKGGREVTEATFFSLPDADQEGTLRGVQSQTASMPSLIESELDDCEDSTASLGKIVPRKDALVTSHLGEHCVEGVGLAQHRQQEEGTRSHPDKGLELDAVAWSQTLFSDYEGKESEMKPEAKAVQDTAPVKEEALAPPLFLLPKGAAACLAEIQNAMQHCPVPDVRLAANNLIQVLQTPGLSEDLLAHLLSTSKKAKSKLLPPSTPSSNPGDKAAPKRRASARASKKRGDGSPRLPAKPRPACNTNRAFRAFLPPASPLPQVRQEPVSYNLQIRSQSLANMAMEVYSQPSGVQFPGPMETCPAIESKPVQECQPLFTDIIQWSKNIEQQLSKTCVACKSMSEYATLTVSNATISPGSGAASVHEESGSTLWTMQQRRAPWLSDWRPGAMVVRQQEALLHQESVLCSQPTTAAEQPCPSPATKLLGLTPAPELAELLAVKQESLQEMQALAKELLCWTDNLDRIEGKIHVVEEKHPGLHMGITEAMYQPVAPKTPAQQHRNQDSSFQAMGSPQLHDLRGAFQQGPQALVPQSLEIEKMQVDTEGPGLHASTAALGGNSHSAALYSASTEPSHELLEWPPPQETPSEALVISAPKDTLEIDHHMMVPTSEKSLTGFASWLEEPTEVEFTVLIDSIW